MPQSEKERQKALWQFEERAFSQGCSTVAGIDEAGRGPLAGPVVACACLLPTPFFLPYLDDSKKLRPNLRRELYQTLVLDQSVSFGLGVIHSESIDQINILQATICAMKQAVQQLQKKLLPRQVDYLLIDGMALSFSCPSEKIIKGDQRSLSIAAASVIAKETRDDLMRSYHKKWPAYGFDRHKGYGTAAHIKAIERQGICPIHRKSFEPIKGFLRTGDYR